LKKRQEKVFGFTGNSCTLVATAFKTILLNNSYNIEKRICMAPPEMRIGEEFTKSFASIRLLFSLCYSKRQVRKGKELRKGITKEKKTRSH
jgi:hypothetical protein